METGRLHVSPIYMKLRLMDDFPDLPQPAVFAAFTEAPLPVEETVLACLPARRRASDHIVERLMQYRIIIKGDIQGNADVRLLEGYLRQLVESASGTPVSRITFHGIVRQRLDEIREMMSFRPKE